MFDLPSPAVIAEEVRAAPLRYVCDDRVTAVCERIAGDFKFLASCIDLVRMPASSFWVEWNDRVLQEVLWEQQFGERRELRADPRVAGVLVLTNETGRAGAIHTCWETPEHSCVDLSPVIIEFDLADDAFSSGGEHGAVALSVESDAAASATLRHVRFRLRREWVSYYTSLREPRLRGEEILQKNLEMVVAGFWFVIGLALLLASEEPLRSRDVDRSRLNKSRARSGRSALLDHVELTAVIGARDDITSADSAAARTAARCHLVRGHLVRRGDAVFWRRSHYRGRLEIGLMGPRVVKLRLAR